MATYVNLTASFPSRVGAGQFSEKKTDEYTSYTLKVAIRNFKTDYKGFFSFDYLNFFVLFCFSFRLGVLDDLLETTDLPSVPP